MASIKRAIRYEALYTVLETLIAERRSGITVLEVGTYDGRRAAALATFWTAQSGTPFTYIGFDLFEDMDPRTNTAEFSKPTHPPAEAVARATILAATPRVTLVKGNTRDTLPAFVAARVAAKSVIDLMFIDGGHSLETVASDWAALVPLVTPETHVLFDDYYGNRADVGCKVLVTALQADPQFVVKILPAVDTVAGTGLQIRMAAVRRKA